MTLLDNLLTRTATEMTKPGATMRRAIATAQGCDTARLSVTLTLQRHQKPQGDFGIARVGYRARRGTLAAGVRP